MHTVTFASPLKLTTQLAALHVHTSQSHWTWPANNSVTKDRAHWLAVRRVLVFMNEECAVKVWGLPANYLRRVSCYLPIGVHPGPSRWTASRTKCVLRSTHGLHARLSWLVCNQNIENIEDTVLTLTRYVPVWVSLWGDTNVRQINNNEELKPWYYLCLIGQVEKIKFIGASLQIDHPFFRWTVLSSIMLSNHSFLIWR